MSLQTLIVFSPFLAVLYVLYGLIQALRRKEQGFIAALLAFITVAGTVAAYVITTDALTKARLTQFMLLNAIIVFVGSLLMLLLERRNPDRDMNRSYGMLGLGMSILLAIGIFVTPLLAGALANSNQASATANNFGNNGTLQTVRAFTPGARGNGGQGNAESTQAADTTSGGQSPLAQALTAQTGLSVDDLNTQITSGSTTERRAIQASGSCSSQVSNASVASSIRLTNRLTWGLPSDANKVVDRKVGLRSACASANHITSTAASLQPSCPTSCTSGCASAAISTSTGMVTMQKLRVADRNPAETPSPACSAAARRGIVTRATPVTITETSMSTRRSARETCPTTLAGMTRPHSSWKIRLMLVFSRP